MTTYRPRQYKSQDCINRCNISPGIREGTNAKYWVGMKRNEVGGLEWTDGSPASYFNWAPGEPSEEWVRQTIKFNLWQDEF